MDIKGMLFSTPLWSHLETVYDVIIIFYQPQCIQLMTRKLKHWGRVMHICVSKLTIIGSDNGLSRRQAIIWTNAGISLIWPLETNFSEISIDIQTFSFKKIHFKMSSGKWRPFCLGLNVLNNHCMAFIAILIHNMDQKWKDCFQAWFLESLRKLVMSSSSWNYKQGNCSWV